MIPVAIRPRPLIHDSSLLLIPVFAAGARRESYSAVDLSASQQPQDLPDIALSELARLEVASAQGIVPIAKRSSG